MRLGRRSTYYAPRSPELRDYLRPPLALESPKLETNQLELPEREADELLGIVRYFTMQTS